jgi:TIR domain
VRNGTFGHAGGGGAVQRRPQGALSFMISYSRPSATPGSAPAPVVDLIGDLNHELSERISGAGTGTYDQEIPIGVPWKRRLAGYLAYSRVLVPLLSPPFFQSEWCGKEWWVFSQRRVEVHPPLGEEEQAVVPIIWVPVDDKDMHSDFRKLQYNNRHMPPAYRAEGLLALQRRRRTDDAYGIAVNHIAARISDLLAHTTIETGKLIDLDTVPNAFQESRGPTWDGIVFWHEEEGSEEGPSDHG